LKKSDFFKRDHKTAFSGINEAETGFEGDLCSIAVHPLSAADTLLLPVA
jgi:hypothetical protein